MSSFIQHRVWRNTCLGLIAVAGAGFAQPAAAQDQSELVSACADAGRQFFDNFDAAADMRADDPRMDGTRTAGGSLDLGNYVAGSR